MGHYLAARYYHVDATLPFFLPAPTLIGTFGAFIRIRSVIVTRKILFDIGIAGPLAGFAMLLLPMLAGVSLSKVIPGIAVHGQFIFGTPLILRLFEWLVFPHVASADIYLHPVARAAWVGLLATALNLLPIGQLDGGHILYSFLGERTRILSRIFGVMLAGLGAVQLFTSDYTVGYLWLFWAAILVLIRHAPSDHHRSHSVEPRASLAGIFGAHHFHPVVHSGPGANRLKISATIITYQRGAQSSARYRKPALRRRNPGDRQRVERPDGGDRGEARGAGGR